MKSRYKKRQSQDMQQKVQEFINKFYCELQQWQNQTLQKKILNLYAPFVKQERSFPIQLKRTIFRATSAILPGTFNRTQNHHQPTTLSDQKNNSNCLLVLSLYLLQYLIQYTCTSQKDDRLFMHLHQNIPNKTLLIFHLVQFFFHKLRVSTIPVIPFERRNFESHI